MPLRLHERAIINTNNITFKIFSNPNVESLFNTPLTSSFYQSKLCNACLEHLYVKLNRALQPQKKSGNKNEKDIETSSQFPRVVHNKRERKFEDEIEANVNSVYHIYVCMYNLPLSL